MKQWLVNVTYIVPRTVPQNTSIQTPLRTHGKSVDIQIGVARSRKQKQTAGVRVIPSLGSYVKIWIFHVLMTCKQKLRIYLHTTLEMEKVDKVGFVWEQIRRANNLFSLRTNWTIHRINFVSNIHLCITSTDTFHGNIILLSNFPHTRVILSISQAEVMWCSRTLRILHKSLYYEIRKIRCGILNKAKYIKNILIVRHKHTWINPWLIKESTVRW
jgi:hypothetical protein